MPRSTTVRFIAHEANGLICPYCNNQPVTLVARRVEIQEKKDNKKFPPLSFDLPEKAFRDTCQNCCEDAKLAIIKEFMGR